MNKYDVVVIGAGPAGIMAAIAAAMKGKKVILLEKNKEIGRKIMATGNGRCNITNRWATVDRYHGANHDFVGKVIGRFDQNATIRFFESLGLVLKEEDRGRMFPRTNQASSVVEVLRHEMGRVGAEVKTEALVKGIRKSGVWEVLLEDGSRFGAAKIILATGGRAAFQFGSSGDGLFWAKKLGHSIVPIHAALVPIETSVELTKEAQGLRIEGIIKAFVSEKEIDSRSGDILFTHFGLSGPAVMGISRQIAGALEKGTVEVRVDSFPEETAAILDGRLEEIFRLSGAKAVKNAMAGVLPSSLIGVVLRKADVSPDKKSAEISKKDRARIIKNIKGLNFEVKSLRPLKEAQVTAGGVDTSEVVAETLESKKFPGLYFAGEILDVDADSGGFNLQWAWSSGYVAGQDA